VQISGAGSEPADDKQREPEKLRKLSVHNVSLNPSWQLRTIDQVR
jgi:hypothetical protein